MSDRNRRRQSGVGILLAGVDGHLYVPRRPTSRRRRSRCCSRTFSPQSVYKTPQTTVSEGPLSRDRHARPRLREDPRAGGRVGPHHGRGGGPEGDRDDDGHGQGVRHDLCALREVSGPLRGLVRVRLHGIRQAGLRSGGRQGAGTLLQGRGPRRRRARRQGQGPVLLQASGVGHAPGRSPHGPAAGEMRGAEDAGEYPRGRPLLDVPADGRQERRPDERLHVAAGQSAGDRGTRRG